LRVRAEPGGTAEHGRLEGLGREELVDDPEAERLLGGIERTTEHQLARALVRQPQAHDLERDLRKRGADRHLVEPDLVRAVEPEAIIAGEHQHEPAGDRVAVDRGHDRLRNREQLEMRGTEILAEDGELLVAALCGREIEPAAEELPGTREHDRANGFVGPRCGGRGGELGEQLVVLRVRGRVVEDQLADAALVILRAYGGHRCLLSCRLDRLP
jgi:hypothetical protein